MGRTIFAVLAGLATIIVSVGLAFIIPVRVAPEFVMEKNSADVTGGFLAYALVVSVLAAVVGGIVASAAGRRQWCPVLILAGLLFVFGLASAAGQALRPEPDRDPAEIAKLPTEERMRYGCQPLWYALALPVVGAAGVCGGGALSACLARRGGVR